MLRQSLPQGDSDRLRFGNKFYPKITLSFERSFVMFHCSFCKKNQKEVKKLIIAEKTAETASICDKCIILCMLSLYENSKNLFKIFLKFDILKEYEIPKRYNSRTI